MIYGHGDDSYRYDNEIRLNFSSNCYSESDHSRLIAHLQMSLSQAISHYPHPEAAELCPAIASRHRIKPDQVAVFSGATEAIYLIAQMLSTKRALIIAPTFSEYESACRQAQMQTTTSSFEDIARHLPEAQVIWLCNPNNPDGRVYDSSVINYVVRNNPEKTFIVDQSYADFTLLPTLKAAETPENLILLHSLTKRYNIPGLRLGYVTASAAVIARLNERRMPWSVNALAIEAGNYLLAHPGDEQWQHIKARLSAQALWLRQEFENTGYISTFASGTHFFLSRLNGNMRVAQLKDQLVSEHGILIRDASNFGLDNCFRIAVSSCQEKNQILLDAVKTIIKQDLQ